jgi:hypothetical protein
MASADFRTGQVLAGSDGTSAADGLTRLVARRQQGAIAEAEFQQLEAETIA